MVSEIPFALHYDAPPGDPWEGWRVTFTLSSFPHGKVPSVVARKGSRKLVDPHKISAILSPDLWPEFAVKTFRQRVGKNDDERLF